MTTKKTTTETTVPSEIQRFEFEGDFFDKILVERFGNKISIKTSLDGFKTSEVRIAIEVSEAIEKCIDEILQLRQKVPGFPALVRCSTCNDEFYVGTFDPDITAWFCRDQNYRECYDREKGRRRYRRP
jgi:hypothetical protein